MPAASPPYITARACVVLAVLAGLAGLALMAIVPASSPTPDARARLEFLRKFEIMEYVCGKHVPLTDCARLHPDWLERARQIEVVQHACEMRMSLAECARRRPDLFRGLPQ